MARNNNMCKSPIYLVASILLVIGGLNWGLMGIGYFVSTNLNVVNLILGSIPVLENIVYVLVGVAGILSAVKLINHLR